MANKFGKFLLGSAALGAAAYGAYYYLRKEEVLTPVSEDEDEDVTSEDLDGEPTKARSYVNLTFDKAKAEDLAKNAVKKARETITDSVQKVEEFFNDEPTVVDAVKDAVEVTEGTMEDVAEEAADTVKDAVEEVKEEVKEDVKEASEEA